MYSTAFQVACLALGQLSQPALVDSSQPAESAVVQAELSDAFDPRSPAQPPTRPRTQAPPTRSFEGRSLQTPLDAPLTIDPSEPQAQLPRFATPEVSAAAAPGQPNRFATSADYTETSGSVGGDSQPSAAEQLAALCVTATDELPVREGLAGKPISLVDVLTAETGNRTNAVKTYWQLAIAVADYQFADDEARRLRGLGANQTGYLQSILRAAVAEAEARRQETRIALLSWQERLNEQVVITSLEGALPWPTDQPLVGPYRTRFDTLFTGSSYPLRLKQIDRALPEIQKQIELFAASVAASSQALAAISTAYRGGQLDVMQVLEAHRRLQQQRQKFLRSLLTYNQEIAEYALQVAGGQPPELLVSTLIRRRRDELVPVAGGNARQALRSSPTIRR